MALPDSICELIAKIVADHPNVSRAIGLAQVAVRALPDYPNLVESLVSAAIQDTVYDARAAVNNAINKQLGKSTGPAKVDYSSETIAGVYTSIYTYYIAGKILGDLYGEEIPAVREREEAIRDGHEANVRLLSALEGLVQPGRRVRDVLSEKKLTKLFQQAKKLSRATGDSAVA